MKPNQIRRPKSNVPAATQQGVIAPSSDSGRRPWNKSDEVAATARREAQKARIARQHEIRRQRELVRFEGLCQMIPPQPICSFEARGESPAFTILRAVDGEGCEHLFIHKPGKAPGDQTSPISRREAIGFIYTRSMPECLIEEAEHILFAGERAMSKDGAK